MNVSILIFHLVGFVLASSASDVNGRSSSVATQLRLLLDEERILRQTLETRVQRLRNEADSLNNTIVPCSCPTTLPRPSSSTPVAFTGTLPAYMTSLTVNTVFNFTNDLINIGQPFHANTGHFVAPVSGLYGFSLAIFMNPGYWTGMELVHNGRPITMVKTGHYLRTTTNRQVNMATNYAVVNVTAGDDIWPQYVSGSSARVWADGVSTFSGVLIHEF